MNDDDRAEQFELAKIEKFEQFMKKVMARLLPNDSMARIRALARELAEGAARNIWDAYIAVIPSDSRSDTWDAQYGEIRSYLRQRWNNDYPAWTLLQLNRYLGDRYQLTKAAFDLSNEAEPTNIFISYRRKDSSPFALLILKSLKFEGLEAILRCRA
jgi:hypothetical protein